MSVQSEREEYYALAKISLQLMVALMHTLQSTLSNLTQLLEGRGGRGGFSLRHLFHRLKQTPAGEYFSCFACAMGSCRETTWLPHLCPRFNSQTFCHVGFKFFVGCGPCTLVFSPSEKLTINIPICGNQDIKKSTSKYVPQLKNFPYCFQF